LCMGEWRIFLFKMCRTWSRRSFRIGPAKSAGCAGLHVAMTCIFLSATATYAATTTSPLGEERDGVKVQGGWAYSTLRDNDGMRQRVAATRAAEDDVWLLIACNAGEQLAMSLIHGTRFPFPLDPSLLLKLQSDHMPTLSLEARRVEENVIFVDRRPMRKIVPRLVRDQYAVVSISEPDGPSHDYTFSMQPNNIALGEIRSHCLHHERRE
jgi:hypothetical protein